MPAKNAQESDCTILYFEDDPISLEDYRRALMKICNVEFGASEELIKKTRARPIDLIILDIMIHTHGLDPSSVTRNERRLINNISYSDEKEAWRLTGIEFIRRIREGKYEKYGIPRDVPVIVYSAVIEKSIRDQAGRLGIVAYLEKPVTINQLRLKVMEALNMPPEGDM